MDEHDGVVVDLEAAHLGAANELGQHDSVMAATAAHYEQQGLEAHTLWLSDLPSGESGMFDVWLPRIKRLVDVETNDTLITIDPHRYEPWMNAGLDIWVVVPEDHLSTVDRRLSKYVSQIQPWTIQGSKVIFGTFAQH